MKILRLEVEDVKRIRAAEIEPSGNVVTLVGRNASGKTSILDSIEMALAGKDSIPPRPVREGARKGRVTMDLGEVLITRTFTPEGGGTLKIEAKVDQGSAVIKSPQTWLNERIGRLALDPLAFMRQDPKQQGETLRKLLGLDTQEMDARRAELYEERRALHRAVRDAEGATANMPHYPNAPAEPVSAEGIRAALQEARQKNQARAAAEADLRRVEGEVERARQAADQRRDLIRRLEAQLVEEYQRLADEEKAIEALEEEHQVKRVDLEKLPSADEEALIQQLGEISQVNAQVEANRALQRAIQDLEEKRDRINAMSEAILRLDAEKNALLAQARFPVEGLGFDEDGAVTYRGLPLSQASGAEQVRVSMAVALALNPKLKLVLIRDASLLDEDSLAEVVRMAEEHDAQVWLERVGEATPGSILIEDGTVMGREE